VPKTARTGSNEQLESSVIYEEIGKTATGKERGGKNRRK
jgi:hypothetical protein